jgi:hypothetical protein
VLFDPTIFDNLKVAIENEVYDLDNLSGQIQVTNRIDRLELAVMAREFAIRLTLTDRPDIAAEIRLEASLRDLAAELLSLSGEEPACTLAIRFELAVEDAARQCARIEKILADIWQPEQPPVQTLSYVYGQAPAIYRCSAELRFARRIDEDQMGDIPDLVDHVLRTLSALA